MSKITDHVQSSELEAISNIIHTYCGHKICLTSGASNLIPDHLVLEGKPVDTDLSTPMLDRQKQLYGRYPLIACFDGGFASKDNLKEAKSRQVKKYTIYEWTIGDYSVFGKS